MTTTRVRTLGNWSWLLVTLLSSGAVGSRDIRAQQAEFIFPTDGATDVSATEAFQWSPFPDADAHYLYVGTTPGAKDLWDSGAIQETSYRGPTLPAGRTLYARLNYRLHGKWPSIDIRFTTANVAAFVYPVDGSTTGDTSRRFEWTEVPGAKAYRLHLGSTPGGNDYLNTGDLTTTSYLVKELPFDRVVHGRVYTKVAGLDLHTDIGFTLPSKAVFVYPPAGGVRVDPRVPIEWTAVPGAEAYYLWVGTIAGAKDLVDTAETAATTQNMLRLPPERPLYARISTKKAGVGWLHQNITFSVARLAASLVYPRHGQAGVDPRPLFRWTPVTARGARYKLWVGTRPGAADVIKTKELTETTYASEELPAARVLYARLWIKTQAEWRTDDAVFTLAPSVDAARIQAPADGAVDVDPSDPLQWTSVPLASGYRLRIGTSEGRNDVHDSGVILVTRRFVPDLPAGVRLFGRLETLIGGTWRGEEFTFTAGPGRDVRESAARRIESALWATNFVRQMADLDNLAYSWSELADVTTRRRSYCSDYAATLLSVLGQMNIPSARRLDLRFPLNEADTHVAVELRDPVSDKWIVLDPTFALAPKRAADGVWATAQDVQQAVRLRRWTDIAYKSLGPFGDHIARSYYIDYPLLYVDVFHEGVPTPAEGVRVLPYLKKIAVPFHDNPALYVVQCLNGPTATLVVDGRRRTLACSGVESRSAPFSASSIAADTGAATGIVFSTSPDRFVFKTR